MAKKRQADFSKTKNKPGRPHCKSHNDPLVKVNTKKIQMPKEKLLKAKSNFTLQDYLLKMRKASNEKEKIARIREFVKFIQRHSESISAHLTAVFEILLNHSRHNHDGLRKAAIHAIKTVLIMEQDLHLHHYANLINDSITALMKIPHQKIASGALELLECMLKNHPELVCHNIAILHDLLPNERKHYTRKNIFENKTWHYSQKEEIDALGYVNAFLINVILLKKKKDLRKQENEDNVVYVDDKTTSVVLYAGGGLNPIDMEAVLSQQYFPEVSPFDEVKELEQIIDALLKCVPSLFCQIMGSESNADGVFRAEAIKDLSILAELLCSTAELAEMISYTKPAELIATFLRERVFVHHKKKFPFVMHSVMPGKSLNSFILLNTSFCFLFAKYLSSCDNCYEDWQLIETYLKQFGTFDKSYTSEIKCVCIPFFVEMIKLYSYSLEVPEAIDTALYILANLVKTRNHPNKKILIDFLFEMSILPDYKFFVNSKGMQVWYQWLTSHLTDPSKYDLKFLKMIVKIAKLKQPSFMNFLDVHAIKSLLKHRNEEFKVIGIFLLQYIDMGQELLKSVSDIICPATYPKKLADMLVQKLITGFEQYPVKERPYVNFIQFLLNVAIDTQSITKKKIPECENSDCVKNLQSIEHAIQYKIVPSMYWKKHSKLFETCLRGLRKLPAEVVNIMYTRFFKEYMRYDVVAIHIALATLKLDNPEITDPEVRRMMLDLNYSCLMTTSVLFQMKLDPEFYKWNVLELLNSMTLNHFTAIRILESLEQGRYGKGIYDPICTYHFLRLLKVFIEKNLLDLQNQQIYDLVYQTLAELSKGCKAVRKQHLFSTLYRYMCSMRYN